MSDFLFASRRRPPGELCAHLERFLAPVTASFGEFHGSWGSLAVARAAHDAPLVVEEGGWLSVLAGDPVLRSTRHGAGLVEPGPRRAELHHLLVDNGSLAWDGVLDAHFAALAVETSSGVGRVLTDAFAFVPLFHAVEAASGGLVVGTHVEAVARASGRAGDVDPVSAADLVANLTCTHPHTLYTGVWQLAPGTDRRFGGDGWADEGRVYWAPTEDSSFRRLDDAAAALREGFRDSLATACGEHPRVGLLMSGGEDSRAVLGALPSSVEAKAVTYAEWESREVRVARAASASYGAELTVGLRRATHYVDGFEAVAGMVGSGHLFVDVHGYGLHEPLGLSALPLVLGGLSSDSLLKANYHRVRCGAPVETPNVPVVRPELLREVALRRTAFRDRLAAIRPHSADEWDTLWPFSMRKHGGNLDGNRRLFRSHEAYHAMDVLRVAAAAPVGWKRHRRLFLAAMRPFLRPAWRVPHAEYRFPYFGRAGNMALFPVLALARGARALTKGEVHARHRPWPRWNVLAERAADSAGARGEALRGSPVGAIFAETDTERISRAVDGWYALRRLMLMQLAHVAGRAGAP